MVEKMQAIRGVMVTHETIHWWGLKFGRPHPFRMLASTASRPLRAGELSEMAALLLVEPWWRIVF